MVIYYGLTEEESKLEDLFYNNKLYKNKAVNLSLKGLKKFIVDNNMNHIIKYYTKVSLINFEINKEIYKDLKYNMIAVKIPFKFKINKIYKINWRKL